MHEYIVVINGCPEVRFSASFFQWLWKTRSNNWWWTSLRSLWQNLSDPYDAFFASSTFPKPLSLKILSGWKLSMENCSRPFLPLIAVWLEIYSLIVLLGHRILHRIYRCSNYITIIFMMMMIM
jgi:hypothetical protein